MHTKTSLAGAQLKVTGSATALKLRHDFLNELSYWAKAKGAKANNYKTNERPQSWSGLIVNSSLEAVASTLPKLEVLGVDLQVIEVKEFEFDIFFQEIFM